MARYGMHCFLWTPEWTPEAAERIVPAAAAHRFDVVEVALLAPERIEVEHSVDLFRAHGVKPTCSLGLPDGAAPTVDPAKAEQFLRNALDVAYALGSKTLTGVTYSTIGLTSGAHRTEEELSAVASVLKPVAHHAETLGMTLGLEPCNRYETHLINTAGHAVDMIQRIGAANVMVHLDTYHMNIEEKGFRTAIQHCGNHLQYIHLSESDRGVPGTGTVDFEEIISALAEIDFQGDMVIESFVNIAPEIARALLVWRPVARDADEVLSDGATYVRDLCQKYGLVAA